MTLAGDRTPARSDTDIVTSEASSPARHHWVNTLVGQIDSAFLLTYEELFAVEHAVGELLNALRIPARGPAVSIPAPLAAEMTSQFWAVHLDSANRAEMLVNRPRAVREGDAVVSLDAWRNALSGLVTSAYPHLAPIERVLLTKSLDDMLSDLGIPSRAARYIPESVIPHHLDSEDL